MRSFVTLELPRFGKRRRCSEGAPPHWVALTLGLLWISSAQASEIGVGTSLWPPYVDPKLPGQGLAISIVVTAFERAGYEPVLTIGPWGHTLEDTKAGTTSVIGAVWKTAEREQDFVFTDPYLSNEIKFLKRRGDRFDFETLEDLSGLRIGVVYRYAYEDAFDKASSFTRAPETHVVPNLLQLLAGNIDLVVGDERTLRYEISRHLQERKRELEFLSKPLASRRLHVAVSRRHPEPEKLVEDFNRALETMREDGTYRSLLRQANEEIWKRSYMVQ